MPLILSSIMASRFSSLALLFLVFNFVSSELILEEGYTVTTVMNGHKLNINPFSVLPGPGSSDLILLDSARSLFYTVPFPLSQESVIKRLSGGEKEGYKDGEPGSAQFRNPRSFAVDVKGNVYVADKSNNVIRKITNSGVTTIAGGYSRKPGHEDGPAQNATFSNDFELTFVAGICVLLISDHGNQLVRQINLKAEDCSRSSQSGSALGAVSIWVLGLGLSCLLGLVIGIVVRPYIIRHEGFNLLHMTWRNYLISLVKQVRTLCFGIKSVVASSTPYAVLSRVSWLSISHISRVLRINSLESKTSNKDVSLLDCNEVRSCEINKSRISADQLTDLISSDGNLDLLTGDTYKQENVNQGTTAVLSGSPEKLDDMIKANVIGFAGPAKEETAVVVGSLKGRSGLVRRPK